MHWLHPVINLISVKTISAVRLPLLITCLGMKTVMHNLELIKPEATLKTTWWNPPVPNTCCFRIDKTRSPVTI